MEAKTGTLFGIGVGPGDPELIPLKSVKTLSRVQVVFAAASTKNRHSLAVNIAQAYIPPTTSIRMLSFPMTRDKNQTFKAWDKNSGAIIAELEQGKDVAFLTLGDPMTYSTYGYILKHIQASAPHITIKTIPGITSYQAAAARLNIPLVEGEESLLITSGVKGGDRLRQLTRKPETVVFMKAYRNAEDIISAINESEAFHECVGISRCGMPGEEILTDPKVFIDRPPNYWTIIIAKQKKNRAPSKPETVIRQLHRRRTGVVAELAESM